MCTASFSASFTYFPGQIRVYGMKFFDETGDYWGNTTSPVNDMLGTRLSARSVKIFADGMNSSYHIAHYSLTEL